MTLTAAQRCEIAQLHKQGMSIARIARRMKCAKDTARRWVQEAEGPKPSFQDAPRSGRPRVGKSKRAGAIHSTTPPISSRVSKIRRHPVSSSTGRQAQPLRKSRLPVGPLKRSIPLSESNKAARAEFCRTHANSQRGSWIYGGSKRYFLYKDQAGRLYWSQQQELQPHDGGRPTVIHFYGFVSKGYKSRLFFVPPTPAAASHARAAQVPFTSEHFASMLPAVKRDLEKHQRLGPRHPIVLDHATQHCASASRAALDDLQLKLVEDFPSQSADINAINDAWLSLDIFLMCMRGRQPTTADGWRRRVQHAWKQVKQALIDKHVSEVPTKMNRVLQLQGQWLTVTNQR